MNTNLPTPYFLFDQEILQKYFDMLSGSLAQNWSNYQIGYSFKTNSLPWLVQFYKKQGVFAEVVSKDEYGLAKYMGFADNEIIYNGPYKDETSFTDVVLAGGIVNVDSKGELIWLQNISKQYPHRKFGVGVRVNFDLEKMCPGETTMGETSGRFGFCYENGAFARALDEIAKLPNIEVKGLHLHSSSKSRSVAIFRSIAKEAVALKREFDLQPDYVDIGGGYCGGLEGRPEFPDYFPAIAEELSVEFDQTKTKLIVEPGISLISKATSFVTSVIDARDIRDARYLITDGSRFNIDATMIKSSYLYQVRRLPDGERKLMDRQEITGYTCMECDRLFTMEGLPELHVGDQIIYENVGGYTLSLNPLFIQYFPSVYVKNKEKYTEVRKKWTAQQYVQNSVW